MVELMFGNPLAAYATGGELAQQMQRSRMQTEAQGMQNEAAGMALQQQKWQMPMQEALYNLSRQENVTADDYTEFGRRYPQMAEVIKPALDSITQEQKAESVRSLSPIMAAANNGRIDVSRNLAVERATAYETAGNKQMAKMWRDYAEGLAIAPNDAKAMGNVLLSYLDPNAFKNAFTQQKAAAELMLQQQELGVKQQNAQTDASRAQGQLNRWQAETEQGAQKTAIDIAKLEQERDKIKNNPLGASPSPDKIQEVFDASDKALTKANELGQALKLFQSEQEKYTWSTNLERYKEWALDNPNAQLIREAYADALHAKIANRIFPGAQSDADIELARGGLPPIDAGPLKMAAYMRGAQKIHQLEAQYNQLKGLWMQENGVTGKAARDLDINGERVKKGVTFQEYWYSKLKPQGTAVEAAKLRLTDEALLRAVPAATPQDVADFRKQTATGD